MDSKLLSSFSGIRRFQTWRQVVAFDLTQTIFEYGHAEALSQEALKQNKRVPVHIKVDSGMGRLGFLAREESIPLVEKTLELPGNLCGGDLFAPGECGFSG